MNKENRKSESSEVRTTKYKQTELGLIPEEWEVKKLGEIGDVKMCRRIFNHETIPDGEIPFFKIGTFGKYPDAFIKLELYNNYKQRFSFPKKGTVLISAAGTIGRTIIYDGLPSYFQDSNIVWIENDENLISNIFLYYLFQTVKYNTEGGTIQRLYNSIIKSTKFLCPTKAEQTAIATALSDADAYIQSLEKLIEKKQNIKQGAMQELLNGKVRLDNFSDEWKESDIASLCLTFTKQTGFDYSAYIKPSLINKYQKGTIPFIQNKDFNGLFINFDTDYFVPEKVANAFPRILLDEKCLLISISGSIGRVAIFSNSQKAFVGGAIAVGKFKDKSLLEWVMFNLQSQTGQDKLFINVKTGSHQNLILDDIRKIKIPIPTREERDKIVLILSDIENEILSLEKKLSKAKQLKQGMMQELLTGKIRLV